jgi:hypothetical protein
MPDALARPAAPTPAVLAARARPTAAAAPTWDRRRWENTALAATLHGYSKLIALVLARRADERGHLPAGGRHATADLVRETGLSTGSVRLSLIELESKSLIRRPSASSWRDGRTRPIDLIVPRKAAVRAEPPHTGERP